MTGLGVGYIVVIVLEQNQINVEMLLWNIVPLFSEISPVFKTVKLSDSKAADNNLM